ncbi:hypothetical protein Tco_0088644 [Tanacetum coccineum]
MRGDLKGQKMCNGTGAGVQAYGKVEVGCARMGGRDMAGYGLRDLMGIALGWEAIGAVVWYGGYRARRCGQVVKGSLALLRRNAGATRRPPHAAAPERSARPPRRPTGRQGENTSARPGHGIASQPDRNEREPPPGGLGKRERGQAGASGTEGTPPDTGRWRARVPDATPTQGAGALRTTGHSRRIRGAADIPDRQQAQAGRETGPTTQHARGAVERITETTVVRHAHGQSTRPRPPAVARGRPRRADGREADTT